jgi:3-phosphoglycerate kinase
VAPIKDFSVFYSRARSLAQVRQAKWPRVSREVQGGIEKTKNNCDKLLLENLRFHGEERLTIQIHENVASPADFCVNDVFSMFPIDTAGTADCIKSYVVQYRN